MTPSWSLALPSWRRLQLPWPRRPRSRAEPRPRPRAELRPLPAVLSMARTAALTIIALLVTVATVVALAESYHALYLWALDHEVTRGWARWWPAMVDTFVALGELALFVAVVDNWPLRYRGYAWIVTAGGLAASVAGNVGHIQTATLASRLTAAVPPLAAFVALTVGMMALKRVLALSGRSADTVAAAAAMLTAIGDADTKTVISALVDAGITDTGTLATIAGVSDRTVRRHRPAATTGQLAELPDVADAMAGARSRHAASAPRLHRIRQPEPIDMEE